MTATHIATTARTPVRLDHGTDRRASIDPALLIAAGLFVAVLLVEAAILALAIPTTADIGSLYITVT